MEGYFLNNINYQKVLDKTLDGLDGPKKLLIHSCCAPCSSYVLEYLSDYFYITVLYYNPNIFPKSEYLYRIEEQKKLINALNTKYPIEFVGTDYEPERFYSRIRGLENEKEGGKRCTVCYRLRLEEAAVKASESGFDYYTTTLSISPLKDAKRLNDIGVELGEKYGVNYLISDFKKKNGYKRSVELSKEYGLYRQDYCGCVYSMTERKKQKNGENYGTE